MMESFDVSELSTIEPDSADCSSIIPRIGVWPETVRETELMTRPKTKLDRLDSNQTFKTFETDLHDA